MTVSKDRLFVTQDFIQLKARVKAEMLRRNGVGSLTAYAGTAYDYTVQPQKYGIPRIEHYSKIRDVMAQINPAGLPGAKKQGDLLADMSILEAKQTLFESQYKYATSGNDCASSCSGTCITTCTSCTGCSGSCSGGCDSTCNSCANGCAACTGCTGTCYATCDGGCSGMCINSCGYNCAHGVY